MSWVLAFVGFAALIILHELGHFAAAKATGMRVERFSLFFPPFIAKVRRGETEYAIGSLPLGGYVKISGMSPHEDLPPEVAPRAYLNQPAWKRIVVIAAGPAVNVLIAFVIIWGLYLADGIAQPALVVDSVQRGSSAAGQLHPGDKILSVDGRPGYAPKLGSDATINRIDDLRTAVERHRCAGRATDGCRATTAASVVVQRGERRLTLRVTPHYSAADKRMLLGYSYGTESVPVGPISAARNTVEGMWRVTHLTVSAIVRIFYDPNARKQVSGVVGSYETTRESFSFDTAQALNVLAIISLSLAVVNLFPFLPLDGGHIFWAVAEKLRGRPVPYRLIERASVVGFMLIAFLFVVGLSNDLGRIRGEGFHVR